jgi:hypothetical protein
MVLNPNKRAKFLAVRSANSKHFAFLIAFCIEALRFTVAWAALAFHQTSFASLVNKNEEFCHELHE